MKFVTNKRRDMLFIVVSVSELEQVFYVFLYAKRSKIFI